MRYYDEFALNEAYEQGQFKCLLGINESVDATAHLLLSKVDKTITLVQQKSATIGNSIIKQRSPTEEMAFKRSATYKNMVQRIKKLNKKKDDMPLILKVLAVISGFIFVIPLASLIFLCVVVFVNTIFLTIFVSMLLSCIEMLLKGSTEALLNFLVSVKNLVKKVINVMVK